MGGVVQAADGVDLQLRVDVPEPGGHGLRLGLAQGGAEGLQLPVQVRQGHGVAVHHGQLPDPRPGQTLGGVAAHAPQAEEDHMAFRQAALGRRPPEHLIAEKGVFHTGPPFL